MAYEKVSVLVKPTQSGKTRLVMEYISELENNIISILFTDNSLLQSTQLEKRMNAFDGIEDDSTIVVSSKSKVKSSNEFFYPYIFLQKV